MGARKALVLCFFPAFAPPSSGGEMRLGGLYRELSRHYDITLLTSADFGARFEEIRHAPNLRELRFPKDDYWRKAQKTLLDSGVVGDLWGLTFALAVSDPGCEYRRCARELGENVDVIIHEFPFSEPIFSEGAPAPEVYNAHNVEASLLSSIVAGPGFDAVWLKLMRMEGNLVRRAQTFAASADDAKIFRLLYGAQNPLTCPNGFSDAEIGEIAAARAAAPGRAPGAADGRATLLFTGSAHPPNVEAADSLLALARYMPDCRFVLAGGVCAAIAQKPRPDNVDLFGPFTAQRKQALLREADLYLNPVVLGSGSSLKAVEALAAHLPMVSTPEGVRGLDVIADQHAIVVAREDFVLAIRRALADPALRARIAARGRELALARFGWRAIADRFAADLAAPASQSAVARPKALAFNDYALTGAPSGGAARVASLLGALDCDVVLLTFAERARIGLLDDRTLQICAPKTADHAAFEARANRGQRVSVNDAVAALFVGGNRVVREIAASQACSASVFIFEHPYMAPALDDLCRLRPDAPVVYSAHNFEAELKRKLLRNHPLARALVGFVAELERRLLAKADLVVCCTQADRARFAKLTRAKTIVAGNGCRIAPPARAAPMAGMPRRVGFLGSGHGPNVEAADYIVRTLAPLFPGVLFELIGSVCGALEIPPPPNVALHGVAPEGVKNFLMPQWDLALNPVTVGGGSSLKLPDYLAHGLPVLSTPEGARGFAVAERGAGICVDLADFPRALGRMLADTAGLATAGGRARAYAEAELSWAATTQAYREALRSILRPPAAATRPKLLVVTYRYTEPARGGAEEYLVEVLKRLRGRFARVDLAAVDVERVENRHHFGCDLTDGPGAAGRIGALFDSARYFPDESLDDAALRRRAQNMERVWAQEEFHLLAPFAKTLADAQAPRLLSGFYGVEIFEGRARRWTAPDFSFLIPGAARFFHLRGVATADKDFELILLDAPADGSPVVSLNCATRLSAHFDVHFALPEAPEGAVRLLLCRAGEHETPPDHRPFGVMVEAAGVSCGDPEHFTPLRTFAADLAFQADEFLRAHAFENWVQALRQAALRRDPETDAAFSSMRGPRAPAMQDWLADHGADYDCVLVQGVPFDVVPSSVATLARLQKRPRIVVLPHFHGDDRFYHWRPYYDAFAAADRTLLFSRALAQVFGGGEQFAVVPGGGVALDDFGGEGARAFREKCPAQNFFLVLGRKTGSKGYLDVIEAHLRLRAVKPDIELVMIGPDDDGLVVDAPGLFALGRQSREVVRGALASCLALVSMSASESFGIVLCEAWLFGKPVIANARCAAFRDLVRPQTGILADGVDELVDAMALLSGDPQARARMGRAGFADVVANHSWERCADALASLLPSSSSR